MLAVYVMSFSLIQSEKISKNFNGVQVSGDKNESGEFLYKLRIVYLPVFLHTLTPSLSLCSWEDKDKNTFS